MKLTTKSEYLILALIYLTRHEKRGFIKIEDICSEYNIPKKYLEQLFCILKYNRYIKTKRGSSGGYRLSVSPKKLSIAQVIRLVDGALAPTESVSKYFHSNTPLEKERKTLKIFKEIREYISSRMENLTFSDLV